MCDFDHAPEIREMAKVLTAGCRNRLQQFDSIFSFVKELPYGFEDWDLKASDILKKGWGMCSGKTNLLVALLRSIGIPARYRIYRIKAEVSLWDKVGGRNAKTERFKGLGEQRDHVDCEVWLSKWMDCDPGRDTAMEQGILKLGGSLERKKVTDKDGRVRYLRLANFDEWARARQKRRTFRTDRQNVFAETNKGFEILREAGKSKAKQK
jgi:hypothetical protein